MSDAQRLAERVVSAMMAKDAFSQWLGVEVVDVRPSGATVRMEVRPEMQNGFGVCHGAIPFALADSALAFASNTHGNITLSIENSITYPKAIAVGDVLTATADEESATKRLAFYRVAVERGTEVVALFRGTVYRTNQPLIAESE
ncbi:MAG TPA: hotdog fold thioesterase [Gemmatimonadaceae bacterium]|jgi:acyl-CoA thioesterase|nr:hotdog fold thioesterase [Gemmatimonadaceae bacterium]